MAQNLSVEEDLIKWCDQQVADGHTLALGWEGGGDSGWCWFELDEEQVSDSAHTPEIRQLIDKMYDELDYGSWAGEFSANGKAVYNPELKAFEGIDYYSEDDTTNWTCKILVKVPKNIWFDNLEINIEDEDAQVDAVFTVRNGFLTAEHTDVLEKIVKQFQKDVDAEVQKFCQIEGDDQYRGIWQNEIINRSSFKEEGDFMVHTFKELSIGTANVSEKEIVLQLTTAEDE